ncbi:choice-of-anchor M domain-containing protein [Arcanobacterium ihumii]|uniref:choice-of-anchor M domain-containing protein n=1 Tax=Arcanobacterium ihumii TaxID=2138162 RepID=UPI000F527413|nr:choice-of-anchor M domain-containing protein [Arcanobacterium ihumii]
MKRFLPPVTKAASVALATALLALMPQSAHAVSDRTEYTGGHIDAFYVYNLDEETSYKNGKYDTNVHLAVKEDVTGHGMVQDPNKVKFTSLPESFKCFDANTKEQFAKIIPDVTGAYLSDNLDVGDTKKVLNPGYTKYLKFPDPEDSGSPYSDSGTRIKFSNVQGPDGGKLIPYYVRYTGEVVPELANKQFPIVDGAIWEMTLGHHHSKWMATKPGVYRFDVTAEVESPNEKLGQASNQKFISETKTYEWEFKKSDLDGTCGEKATNPSTPSGEQPHAASPHSEDAVNNGAESSMSENVTTTPGNSDTTNKPASDGRATATLETDSEGRAILDRGHADIFNVQAKEGKLALNIKEDVSALGTIRTPENVVLKVTDAMREDLSVLANKGVLPSGYFLPDPQKNGQEWPGGSLWPGWETFDVRPEFSNIDIQFEEVSGPGRVQMFTFKNFGELTPVLSDKKLDLKSGSSISVPDPTHVHTNWLFEKPGEYTMKVKASGKNKAGELVVSNTATYTWHVGTFPKEAAPSIPAPVAPVPSDAPISDVAKPNAGVPVHSAISAAGVSNATVSRAADATVATPLTTGVKNASVSNMPDAVAKTPEANVASLATTGASEPVAVILATLVSAAGVAIMLGRRRMNRNC